MAVVQRYSDIELDVHIQANWSCLLEEPESRILLNQRELLLMIKAEREFTKKLEDTSSSGRSCISCGEATIPLSVMELVDEETRVLARALYITSNWCQEYSPAAFVGRGTPNEYYSFAMEQAREELEKEALR